MKLTCVWCQFATAHASEMTAHLVNTGHGIDADLLDDLRISQKAYGELSATLGNVVERVLAKGCDDADVEIHGMTGDQGELCLQAHQRASKSRLSAKQLAAWEITNLPTIQVILALVVLNVFRHFHFGMSMRYLDSLATRRELLARHAEAALKLGTVLQSMRLTADDSPITVVERLCREYDQQYPGHALYDSFAKILQNAMDLVGKDAES